MAIAIIGTIYCAKCVYPSCDPSSNRHSRNALILSLVACQWWMLETFFMVFLVLQPYSIFTWSLIPSNLSYVRVIFCRTLLAPAVSRCFANWWNRAWARIVAFLLLAPSTELTLLEMLDLVIAIGSEASQVAQCCSCVSSIRSCRHSCKVNAID
jgi:hypothetical protein